MVLLAQCTHLELITSISTFILVLVTGYYAYLTNKISKTAKNQLRFTQRPYINIDAIEMFYISIDENIKNHTVRYSNISNVPIKIDKIQVCIDGKLNKTDNPVKIIAPEKQDSLSFSIDIRKVMQNTNVKIILYYTSVFDAEESFTLINLKLEKDKNNSGFNFNKTEYKSGYSSELNDKKRLCT